jgi:hypothetical protein
MSWDTNGKALIKYDGIEFSLPLWWRTTTILPSIFLNRIGLLLVNILEKKEKKNI